MIAELNDKLRSARDEHAAEVRAVRAQVEAEKDEAIAASVGTNCLPGAASSPVLVCVTQPLPGLASLPAATAVNESVRLQAMQDERNRQSQVSQESLSSV